MDSENVCQLPEAEMSLEDADLKAVNVLHPTSTRSNSYAFGKSSRIKKSHEYDRVFSEGKKFVTKTIVVFSLPSCELSSRFGLVVSKKSVGIAVSRNKVKRRLREVFRHLSLSESEPRDIVIIARHTSAGSSLVQLEKDMKRALHHLGLGRAR